MRMSTEETKKKITELQNKIQQEQRLSKRWIFLAATINSYSKQIGRKAPYKW